VRAALRFVFALPSCILLACLPVAAGPKAADRDERRLESALSAIATADMAIDAWLAATVPAHYARRTLEVMRLKLDESENQEASASHSRLALQPVGEMLDRARGAVTALDRAAAAHALEDFRGLAGAIRGEPRTARRP
jgi:hypothetical protein